MQALLAIICAVSDEVSGYLNSRLFRPVGRDQNVTFHESPLEPGIVIVVVGIGRRSAEKGTVLTIETYNPSLVINVGFAGGVNHIMKTGDLIVCDRVWAVQGAPSEWTRESAESLSIDHKTIYELLPYSWTSTSGVSRSDCLSVPRVASETSEKARIGSMFPVSIIDMESFWVVRVATQHQVPSAIVKVVLDPLKQTLPSFVDRVAAKGASGQWQHALRFALSRPSEIPSLFRLMSQVKVAKTSLETFLKQITSQYQTGQPS